MKAAEVEKLSSSSFNFRPKLPWIVTIPKLNEFARN